MTASATEALKQAAGRARVATARLEQRIACVTIVTPALGTIVALALAVHGTVLPGRLELTVALILILLTELGVTVGFHRLFVHRSFTAPRPVRVILGILGSMAAQGPPLFWAAAHRHHHVTSDRPDDPHSPHGTGRLPFRMLHAHLAWMLALREQHEQFRLIHDLLRDRAVVFVSLWYPAWVALGLLIPGAVSGLWHGSVMGAVSGLLWGGLVRMFLVHHATWSVNSLGHIAGRQRFLTKDESRNNVFVALITLGEGWHNNHHAFPYSARHGFAWWEFDPSWLAIRLLAWLGIAREVRLPRPDQMATKCRGRASEPRPSHSDGDTPS
ncbi:MAG: fatty acid desaturase [Aliidongia sp.]